MLRSFTYLSQSAQDYKVQSESGQIFSVPKLRRAKPLPVSEKKKFFSRGLKIAFAGIPLGGILTVIFAPIVIWKNVRLIRSKILSQNEITYSKNLIFASSVVLLIGVTIFGLFIIHLVL